MAGIMIVEDQKETREMLSQALTRNKFQIIEASNGREALVKFKPTMVNLVITDILMPEEDGLQVIIKLKELNPKLKIIAISGGGKIGPANYLNIAKTLGADEILFKPFSVKELLKKVQELLPENKQS